MDSNLDFTLRRYKMRLPKGRKTFATLKLFKKPQGILGSVSGSTYRQAVVWFPPFVVELFAAWDLPRTPGLCQEGPVTVLADIG